jgi:hypothetical protein
MSLVPTMGSAMVLLTSGIVDEALCRMAGAPQYYLMLGPFGGGCWVWNLELLVGGWRTDTLLSFEESGPLVRLLRGAGWWWLFLSCGAASFVCCVPVGVWLGVGGRVVC